MAGAGTPMKSINDERRERGNRVIDDYRPVSGDDREAALDAICDVLLAYANEEAEGLDLLRRAENHFAVEVNGDSEE